MKILESTFVDAAEIPDTVLEGGKISLPFPILSWKDREKIPGMMVDPTKHAADCKTVYVPSVAPYQLTSKLWVLDSVSYRANNVLKAAETKDPVILQRSVDKYRKEVLSRLFGKTGMLSRYIGSTRCENSARFVIVPAGAEVAKDQVGVPEELAKRAGIAGGDIVILSRAPVLWQGSVLLMRAVLVPGLAGRLSPFCLKDLAADFDGDTVSVIKWPIDCWAGLNGLIDSILGPESPDLPTEFRLSGGPWTLGPEDLMNPKDSEFLAAYSEVKDIPKDMDDYAKGLSLEGFMNRSQEVILDVGRMKMHLGLVGSITDKICALVDDDVLPVALRAKEKITQALFDSKHGEKEAFSALDLSDVYERRGGEDMLKALEKCGVESAEVIVNDLIGKGVPPLTKAFRGERPDLAVMKDGCTHDEILHVLEVLNGHG